MPDYLSKELWLGLLPLSSHALPTPAVVVQLLSLANQIGTVLPWIALCFLTIEGEVVFLALFSFVRRYLLRFLYPSFYCNSCLWGGVYKRVFVYWVNFCRLSCYCFSVFFRLLFDSSCVKYAVTSVFLPVTSLSLFWWSPLFLRHALHMIYLEGVCVTHWVWLVLLHEHAWRASSRSGATFQWLYHWINRQPPNIWELPTVGVPSVWFSSPDFNFCALGGHRCLAVLFLSFWGLSIAQTGLEPTSVIFLHHWSAQSADGRHHSRGHSLLHKMARAACRTRSHKV